jgi:hypothetical protein
MKNAPPIIVEIPSDELGGASGARLFRVLAVGKRNTPQFPYCVANEKIATEIGRALGLRIPEVLLYRLRGEWHAFSCFVPQTESGEGVPEGTASELARYYSEHPEELHGMITFDLFVGNNDRKTDNLILGEDGLVRLIDHANALFYRPTETAEAGTKRLTAISKNLSTMFDRKHWFLAGLSNWELVDRWCDRMASLPTYLIESVIDELPAELLAAVERKVVRDFLDKRKNIMRNIINDNLSLFPNLK